VRTKLLTLIALSALPFVVTACGEYEVVYTRDIFPYGDDRTAGSGVMYVPKKMMPAKELNLAPVSTEVKMRPKDDPLQKAFRDYQKKSKI
jgi:hypothetical protein